MKNIEIIKSVLFSRWPNIFKTEIPSPKSNMNPNIAIKANAAEYNPNCSAPKIRINNEMVITFEILVMNSDPTIQYKFTISVFENSFLFIIYNHF